MKKLLALIVVVLVGFAGFAQDNEFDKMMREMYQQEFIDIVNENMNLSEPQNAIFQPIFSDFITELGTVMDAKLKTQYKFAKYFESMTDEQVKIILSEVKSNRKNYDKVLTKYIKKMQKELNPQTAFRFFLIVEKVKYTFDYNTVVNLPLVEN
jgi:ABC-type transporter MlaC component